MTTTTSTPTTTTEATTISPEAQEIDDLIDVLAEQLLPDQVTRFFPNGFDQLRADPVAGLEQLRALQDDIDVLTGTNSAALDLMPMGNSLLLLFVLFFMRLFK